MNQTEQLTQMAKKARLNESKKATKKRVNTRSGDEVLTTELAKKKPSKATVAKKLSPAPLPNSVKPVKPELCASRCHAQSSC